MNWREYWNADTPIYVSERHKVLHYAGVARDIAALVPGPDATVLDFGCGEALSADRVAARCLRLLLCDSAALVRGRLQERFADEKRIAVLSPEGAQALDERSLDLVVANSVAQYLTLDELRALLITWRGQLKGNGRLVVADVIPPDVGALTDASALLRFAWRGGFLRSALVGLGRTALSDYRAIREELGLSRYGEAEMIDILRSTGFVAERRQPNIGHNQARMTFVASPA
ncbi:MAG TPA: class I SAM-dependent methyltransferase [Beijerinckiaceae bacterium]|jgi:SAM-dependent methyltransferase